MSEMMSMMQGMMQAIHGLVAQNVTMGQPSTQPAPAQVVQQTTNDEGVKLDEFLKHQPPTFCRTDVNEDPQEFIDETENLCDALHCPSWRSVELVSFRLRGVARSWFAIKKRERSAQQPQMEWEEFKILFLDRFLPVSVRDARTRKFETLKQGDMTVTEYANKFEALSAYAPHLVSSEEMRIKRFIAGLRNLIFRAVSSTDFLDFSKAVDKA
ncbi:hypothetical protein QQ045_019224 [Rhodiola kirilowii]